ncbi:MAG TPA: acetyl-CoA carboxylase biotin carboxylase subunit [bacterium]
MFKKILIANRGEIAVRILRACREMGIATVAVYSEADQTGLHVIYADESYYLGPAPARDSYLKIEALIAIARESGAEAIHPGYGFLAENEDFAQACADNRIVFIGPSARAIRLLGDKIASKKTMVSAGVPVVPGSPGAVTGDAEALKLAGSIGLPVLIKASGGGGGKGMRVVRGEKDLPAALKQARGEAQSAFGNPTIFIEKFLDAPRHIEFQILADEHGNVIHLGERECSVQRRHQKLIEESPSAIMNGKLRATMGEAAVKAVKASGYTNAGTVEFMVDKGKKFYFLEMNTRLQVEHPVTELVTGVDIVKEQLRIAAGEKLSLHQEQVQITGAAIECRISAEDPAANFAPSTGRIKHWLGPGGPGVRLDSGVYEGFEVPVYYDPLIAKLLVWASSREEAIERMERALGEFNIDGIKTTVPFHRLVMANEKFRSGNYDTTFIDSELGAIVYEKKDQEIAAMAAVVFKVRKEHEASAGISGADHGPGINPWKQAGRPVL